MLRSVIEHDHKTAPAYMKVSAAASTGMGVVISSGALAFPAAETADDIYVLNKARVPSGTLAAQEYVSDYDSAFNTLAANEFALAYNFDFGEQFATDQYDATSVKEANIGKVVSVNTSGKWVVAAGTVASKYIFTGFYTDNGHTLALIRVSDTATKNA